MFRLRALIAGPLLAVMVLASTGLFTPGAAPVAASPASFPAPAPIEAPLRSLVIQTTFVGQWPPEALAAYELATAQLGRQINATVPIRVKAAFEPMAEGTLGSGGPGTLAIDFPNAPRTGVFYPPALAAQFAGQWTHPDADVEISLSSSVNWYYGPNPLEAGPDRSDFVTTVMHEIIHGMGFMGTADIVDGVATLGDDDGRVAPSRRIWHRHGDAWHIHVVPARPALQGQRVLDIFDQFVVTGAGAPIASFIADPVALADQLQGNALFWNGPAGVAANEGQPVKLFAPNPWSKGSSYGHFDDAIYDGGPDAMLTSAGANIQSIVIGPRTLGVLADMGWSVNR